MNKLLEPEPIKVLIIYQCVYAQSLIKDVLCLDVHFEGR